MMKRSNLAALTGTGILGGMLVARVVRPWYLHWGATDEEFDRVMPLDDLVPNPTLNSTMAVTVNAPPEQIWPWIAQIGEPPRAGYYSYTLVERMVGLDVVNRDEILPQYQHLATGDRIDRAGTMCVLAVEPRRYVVLGPPPGTPDIAAAWSIALYPVDERCTRLITRVRSRWSYRTMLGSMPVYTWPIWLFLEPGIFLMCRKMLLEIKRLAERDTSPATEPPSLRSVSASVP